MKKRYKNQIFIAFFDTFPIKTEAKDPSVFPPFK